MSAYLEAKGKRTITFELPPLAAVKADTKEGDAKEKEGKRAADAPVAGEKRTIAVVTADELVRTYTLLLEHLYFKVCLRSSI